MKPKTKMEKYIANLKLKDYEINLNTVFDKIGYYTKLTINCMYCGASNARDNQDIKNYTCSSCGYKLKLEQSLKRTACEEKYVDVVEAVNNIQIFRTYFAYRHCKVGQVEKKNMVEVYRWFVVPEEMLKRTKKTDYVMAVYTSGYYNRGWCLGTEMEFREPDKYKYTQYVEKVYIKKLIDKYKYASYNDKTRLSTYEYFKKYEEHQELELLSKAKQYELIYHIFKDGFSILTEYKNELKTVFRNKYKIKDYSIWKDYIDLLKYFNKDTTSPRWCCPKNLNKEHDKLVAKKDMIIYEEENNKFISRMLIYQNINFGNEKIEIVAFKDVYEVKHEGNLLQHCVFKSGYHKKENNLLLSVRENNKPIATAEINIEKLSISQIRGVKNDTPPHYEEIKSLIEKNVLSFLKKQNKKVA